MAIQPDFTEYYKTISNTELLSILENPGDYQPEAIEAAKKEFSDRQLSEAEITEAREPTLAKRSQKEKQREKIRSIETKVRTTGINLIETLNPIQSGIQTSEKIIRYIVVIFGIFLLYQLFSDRYLIIESIKEVTRFPTASLIYLIPLLLSLVAIITFWKRKQIGWILLTIFLTFSFVAVVWVLVQTILRQSSGNSFTDNFISPPAVTPQVIQFVFFTGILYVVSKKNIREVFSVSEDKMLATIIITGLFTSFLIYGIS